MACDYGNPSEVVADPPGAAALTRSLGRHAIDRIIT
jgi:hypothetical protein